MNCNSDNWSNQFHLSNKKPKTFGFISFMLLPFFKFHFRSLSCASLFESNFKGILLFVRKLSVAIGIRSPLNIWSPLHYLILLASGYILFDFACECWVSFHLGICHVLHRMVQGYTNKTVCEDLSGGISGTLNISARRRHYFFPFTESFIFLSFLHSIFFYSFAMSARHRIHLLHPLHRARAPTIPR